MINKKQKMTNCVDLLCSILKKLFISRTELALDETIVTFRGKTEYLQYNKNKPDKFGLKFFSLADSTTGFMLKMILFEGKKHKKIQGLGLVDTVVYQLLSDYKHQAKIVSMDSYYTSPNLFQTLTLYGFDFVGTVQKNRKGDKR